MPVLKSLISPENYTLSSFNELFRASTMSVNNGEAQIMAALYLSMDDMARVDPCLVVHVDDEEESTTSTSVSET